MMGTILQVSNGALDKWSQGNVFEAFITALQGTGPLAVFAMLASVPLYIGLYYWSKTHTVPIATMFLMGSAVLPLLPSAAARLAWIAMLLTGAASLFGVYWTVIR